MELDKKTLHKRTAEWLNELSLTARDEISLEMSQGVKEIAPKDGYKCYEPDPSRKTLIIQINGGSGEEYFNKLPNGQPFRQIQRKEYGSILNNEPAKG